MQIHGQNTHTAFKKELTIVNWGGGGEGGVRQKTETNVKKDRQKLVTY
jgi:hypothetical protein